MLTPEEAQRRGQKYDERCGLITAALLARHLAGEIALAAPAAVDNQAHLLPLDIDAGGIATIRALIAEAQGRDLWAFGQYCPRPGWSNAEQRGYVWLPFNQLADKERVMRLGEHLIADVAQPGWKIEARAHAAVTRLPLARHMITGRFGDLVINGQIRAIDDDPAGALLKLHQHYHENPVSSLPPPPLPAPAPRSGQKRGAQPREGITIARYNQDTDLIALLEHYGARRAKGSRRLLHCCGHADDRRASLLLWERGSGKHYCKCLSQYHNCPLAGQMRDAFAVYCAIEGLTTAEALRRLNGR
jgi:hypothetical protein